MEPIVQTSINTKSDELGCNSVEYSCPYCKEANLILGKDAQDIIMSASIQTGLGSASCPKCNKVIVLDIL